MLTEYIQAAMRHARCKRLPEDGANFCAIPETPGVWASAATEEAGLRELREVLEDWIALGLAMRHALPVIDGIDLKAE
ncbi:MAG TPA: hypothetical protein VFW96_12065 [Thermomicrobiales bacterium]|nr:hypothetical protein [Thermomicrobiales bacterium]